MQDDNTPKPPMLAMRWPEPVSFVFSVTDTKDVDAIGILEQVVEENGGEWEQGKPTAPSTERSLGGDVTGYENVFRANFSEETIDGIVNTFNRVDAQLRDRLNERSESESSILRQINWYTGSTPCCPGHGSGGGPGARPAPCTVDAGRDSTPLANAFVGEALHSDATPVRLIILDAWNREDNEAKRLKDLTSGAKVLYALNGAPNEDGFDVTLNDYAANRENDPFPIPDHGVFVAAAAAHVAGWQHMTLHSSVPSLGDDENLAVESNGLIQMESVRVLGEYGVGDTYQLVRQLERIADSIQPNEKVIINLSLVINTPPEGFAVRRLFGADSGKSPADLHVALHKAIDRLYKKGKGALIIAAAGNSSAGEAGRERALYPAAFDEVLAVTAATPDGTKEAYYANRVYSKGVAVFGGTVKKDVASGKLVVDEKFPLDGPFTDSKVPVFGEDPDNDSGQVLWAGTSFATPRVAGLAARIWLAEPELSAGDVRAKVQALATGKLQCGTPYIDLAKKAEKADA